MSYILPDPKYFYLRGTIPDGGVVNIVAKDSNNIYHYLTYNKEKEMVVFDPEYKLDPTTGDIINVNPVLNCIIRYVDKLSHSFSISFMHEKKVKYLKPNSTISPGKFVMSVDDKEYSFTYITTHDLNSLIAGDTHTLIDTTSSANQIYWQSYGYTKNFLVKSNNTFFVDNNNETISSINILSVKFLPIVTYEFSSGNIVSDYNPIVIDAKWVTSSLDTNYIKYASVGDAKLGNPDPRYCNIGQDCDLNNCYTIKSKDGNTTCTYDKTKKIYYSEFEQKGGEIGINTEKGLLIFLMFFLGIILSITFGLFGNNIINSSIRGIIMFVTLGLLALLFYFYSNSQTN